MNLSYLIAQMGSTSRVTWSRYVRCILSFLIKSCFILSHDIMIIFIMISYVITGSSHGTVSWFQQLLTKQQKRNKLKLTASISKLSRGRWLYHRVYACFLRPVFGALTWRWTWCRLALGIWWCCCSLLRCCSRSGGSGAGEVVAHSHIFLFSTLVVFFSVQLGWFLFCILYILKGNAREGG